MGAVIRVVVVDDDPLVRAGLKMVLETPGPAGSGRSEIEPDRVKAVHESRLD